MTDETRIDALEYVLALEDGDTRRATALRVLDDPDLADAVWEAEAAVAPLGATLRPRAPRKRVWKGLEARLFDAAPSRPRGGRALAVSSALASLFGAASLALGALVAVLLVRPDVILPPAPEAMAAVIGVDGTVTLARVRPGGTVVTAAFAGALPPTRDPELWIVYEGAAPRSLGVMARDGQTVVDLVRMEGQDLSNAQFVITDEPLGGSPTGDPTGPAIASGPIQTL
ncbi:MAG: anti-sigma factor [Pseudomonadota bacterium]